jgi:hypothetical protein
LNAKAIDSGSKLAPYLIRGPERHWGGRISALRLCCYLTVGMEMRSLEPNKGGQKPPPSLVLPVGSAKRFKAYLA